MIEWKTIQGFSRYEASNTGLLRSLNYKRTGQVKVLKPVLSGGYLKTMLQRDNKKYSSMTVHFFVTLAFYGPRPKDLTVDHIDGNKQNNNINNLEYVTRSENVLRAFKLGLAKPMRGSSNGNSKLTEQDVKEIREYVKNFNGPHYGRKALAEKYGISEAHIKDLISGRRGIWKSV